MIEAQTGSSQNWKALLGQVRRETKFATQTYLHAQKEDGGGKKVLHTRASGYLRRPTRVTYEAQVPKDHTALVVVPPGCADEFSGDIVRVTGTTVVVEKTPSTRFSIIRKKTEKLSVKLEGPSKLPKSALDTRSVVVVSLTSQGDIIVGEETVNSVPTTVREETAAIQALTEHRARTGVAYLVYVKDVMLKVHKRGLAPNAISTIDGLHARMSNSSQEKRELKTK